MESREERTTDRSDVKLNRESERGVRRGGGETGEAWRCRENKGWKPARERENAREWLGWGGQAEEREKGENSGDEQEG